MPTHAQLTVTLALVAGSAHGLPTNMQAFGRKSWLSRMAFSDAWPVPSPGAIHSQFGPLPANDTGCELLLQVAFSSVNPSDVHPSMAKSGTFPKAAGSDVAGTVIATSGNCTRLQMGDAVFGDIGANTHILKTSERTKELGAYAQFAVALEGQVAKVPDGIGLAEAGSLPKVALTSYKALVWYARMASRPSGTRVLILGGSSGTGSVGIQMAKRAFGITTNVTATTSQPNFPYVHSLGADELIDYKRDDWWEVLADGSMDVVYDCVGEHGTGARAVAKLRPGGSYVTITGAVCGLEMIRSLLLTCGLTPCSLLCVCVCVHCSHLHLSPRVCVCVCGAAGERSSATKRRAAHVHQLGHQPRERAVA